MTEGQWFYKRRQKKKKNQVQRTVTQQGRSPAEAGVLRVILLLRFMFYITQGSVADGEEYGEGRGGKRWALGRYRREQQMVGSVLFFVPTVSAAWVSF